MSQAETQASPDPKGLPGGPAEMSLLDHLDELRSRLFKAVLGYAVVFGVLSIFHEPLLEFILDPIRRYLYDGGSIVFINLTEPFFTKLKATAIVALFVAFPFLLYQLWSFISPGLHKRERRLAIPFLFFGTLFFAAGGAFGYYVAIPVAAKWLIDMGSQFTASITLRSAVQFETALVVGMGAVFEMPIIIFFLARLGIVTPGFLMRNFRMAVLIMAVLSAVITPTGDWVTMSVFCGPMILLYLLGVLVSWIAEKRDKGKSQ